jgi:hypothetical protein
MDTPTSDAPGKSKPTGSLEYEGGFSPYAGRGRYRLLLGLTLLNTLMLAGLIAAPYFLPFIREKWEQWQAARAQERERLRIVAFEQQCLTHAWPEKTVVYEEDPAEAAKLLARPDGGYEPVLRGLDTGVMTRLRRRRRGEDASAPPVPPGYQSPVRAVVPTYVQDFFGFADFGLRGGGGGGLFAAPTPASEPAMLFLHERVTASGQRFLVGVWLEPGYSIGSNHTTTDQGGYHAFGMTKQRQLVARAWSVPPAPAQPVHEHEWRLLLALPDLEVPELARVPAEGAAGADAGGEGSGDGGDDGAGAAPPVSIEYGRKLRIFAGQADPADGSHFTIPYQLDGNAGTIDGRVRDDGIVLRPREGAAASAKVMQEHGAGADEGWDLTAPAAARQPPRADEAR